LVLAVSCHDTWPETVIFYTRLPPFPNKPVKYYAEEILANRKLFWNIFFSFESNKWHESETPGRLTSTGLNANYRYFLVSWKCR